MKKIKIIKAFNIFVYALIFGCYMCSTAALANNTSIVEKMQQQTLQVSGTITDANGTLPGVSITVKGKPYGTVSGLNGKYTIEVASNDILVFSFLGYRTATMAVEGRTQIDVQLQEDMTALQEVQINAGYYTTTDREKTGSLARITAKTIEKQPVNNPLETLQGRLSGVDIVQNSGIPGGGFDVKIRGLNSIMAGNSPLYVIDGVPYNSQTLGSRNSSGTIIPLGNISPLNAINPSIIESIEVLKDADATAIYGSRGANGVILITTKKGKQGKTKLTLSTSMGVANITKKLDLLNTEQYLEMRQEAFANDGITNYPANAYDINGVWDINRYTDWQKVLIGETAYINQLQASVTGGNENTQFLLSGMYQKETTVYQGDFNYDRITVNSSVQHSSVDKRFKVAFNAGYTLENNLLPIADLTRNALLLPPNAPALYDDGGNLNWENRTWTNPLAQLQGKYTNNTNNLIANTVLNYQLFDEFEIKINSGYNFSILEDNRIIPHTIYNPAFGLNSSVSQAYVHRGQTSSFIIEPQFSWSKNGENSSWNVILGTTFQSKNDEMLTLLGVGFANNSFLGNLSAATNLIILNENNQEYKYQSVFARINYAHRDKIFLNATARRDGSSRFGPGNRYGNFGAIGAAWLFSEELKWSWVNLGKLRGSYGITGNDQIGDYQYLQTYAISTQIYDGNIGLQPARLFNPNFNWEENKKIEVALEMGLFNNRILMTTAYYNNRSSNQLINYALSGITGFTSIQSNLNAKVENSGWEFELSGDVLSNKDFKWNYSFNLSLPKNKLLEFPGLENSTYANQFVIGKPLPITKLYRLKGVNPETGLFEFDDYNNDGLITAAEDRQSIADLTPKFYGGISNTLSYKDWKLDVFFQFVKKNAYNEFYGSSPVGTMSNKTTSVLDRWQASGDQSTMQQFTSGSNYGATLAYSQFSQSSGAVSDASFIRLKSLALAYTLPLDKNEIASCRFSLQGQNLLTLTRYKGGDPEQQSGFLPPLKRIVLGIQLQL